MARTPNRTATIAMASLLGLGVGSPSSAADGWQPFMDLIDPGVACADFPVQIEFRGTSKQARTLPARDGDTRFAVAGRDYEYRFVNPITNATFTMTRSASLLTQTTRPDGTARLAINGNAWVVLYPTDTPAGPSTTVFSGRVVINVAADGTTYEVVQWTGRRTDVCAALA
jgi:hypothetical protein